MTSSKNGTAVPFLEGTLVPSSSHLSDSIHRLPLSAEGSGMDTPSPTSGSQARRYGLGSVAALAMLLAGCGEIAENLVEEGVEQAIEADSGEDVELDFNGDGGISIETEEGSMSIDEDGNFVIEGADGETVTGEANEDGFTVTDEDGSSVIDIDEDNGQVTAETDEGSFTAGPGMPDDWPGSVPQPSGLDDVNGSSIDADGQILITVGGTTSGDATDYFDDYTGTLEDAGFSRSSYFEQDGFRQGLYDGSDFVVSVVSDPDASSILVTVSSDSN